MRERFDPSGDYATLCDATIPSQHRLQAFIRWEIKKWLAVLQAPWVKGEPHLDIESIPERTSYSVNLREQVLRLRTLCDKEKEQNES